MRVRGQLILPLAAAAAMIVGGGVVTGIAVAADDDGLTAVYATSATWPGGQTGTYTVTNRSDADIADWHLSFSLPIGAAVASLWNGTVVHEGPVYTITPTTWNAVLAPGTSAQFGFTVASAREVIPGDCLVNDHECAGTDDPRPAPTATGTAPPPGAATAQRPGPQ